MRTGPLAAALLVLASPDHPPPSASDVLTVSPAALGSARFTARLRVEGDPVPVPDGGILVGPEGVRIDWHDPAGGTLGSWVATDGQLVWRDPATRRAWQAPYADLVVRALTGGRLDLTTSLGLLTGHPRGMGELVDARWRADGTIQAAWRGAVPLVAVHDRRGRPLRATIADPRGRPILVARWLWDDDLRTVELVSPRADTVLAIDFAAWTTPTVGVAAFAPIPEGFSAARLEAWPTATEPEEQGQRQPRR